MFVDDTLEYTGTSVCRLSAELYGCTLTSRKRSGSVCIIKPSCIRSRVRRILTDFLSLSDTHDLRSGGYILC